MRYFTTELFEDLNRGDEALAIKTLRKWDAAQDKYRAEYSRWIKQAPVGVRQLTLDFYAHDGTIAASGHLGEAFYYLFFVSELNVESVICYQLLGEPVLTRHESSAQCWDADPLWLYDEVSRIALNKYRHEILFGDGRILKVEFRDVAIRSWAASKAANGSARPRVELTMPGRAAAVTSLSAAMKLWSIHRRPTTKSRKSQPSASRKKKPRSISAAGSAARGFD